MAADVTRGNNARRENQNKKNDANNSIELCLFQYKKKSKSTNQYILNFVTQDCVQKVRYHQASTIGNEANPS